MILAALTLLIIALALRTGLSHEHSAAIDHAVQWLMHTPRRQRGPALAELRQRGPALAELRQRFGLTTQEACAACREAHMQKARAA